MAIAKGHVTALAPLVVFSVGIHKLTATEFKLLRLLAERKGRIQSRERLLKEACGYEKESHSRTVDTHMRRLRKKPGASRYVQTVRGFGYRLAED